MSSHPNGNLGEGRALRRIQYPHSPSATSSNLLYGDTASIPSLNLNGNSLNLSNDYNNNGRCMSIGSIGDINFASLSGSNLQQNNESFPLLLPSNDDFLSDVQANALPSTLNEYYQKRTIIQVSYKCILYIMFIF